MGGEGGWIVGVQGMPADQGTRLGAGLPGGGGFDPTRIHQVEDADGLWPGGPGELVIALGDHDEALAGREQGVE